MACETKTLIPDALYMTIMGKNELHCGKCANETLKQTILVAIRDSTKLKRTPVCVVCKRLLIYDGMQFGYMKEKHETGSAS